MKKNILNIACLYQSVVTRKGAVFLAKACSDEFLELIAHKAWIFLHESFSKSDVLYVSDLREEMSKIKIK